MYVSFIGADNGMYCYLSDVDTWEDAEEEALAHTEALNDLGHFATVFWTEELTEGLAEELSIVTHAYYG